jgi:cysteinyl-tRNA synthetase
LVKDAIQPSLVDEAKEKKIEKFAPKTTGFEQKVLSLIEKRASARIRKDFDESDRIRNELASMGVVLKDRKDPDGKLVTTWEMVQ